MNDNIPAIDAWCNPFTELGIKTIFTENPEVAFMMGDQWGRHDNMRWHTADEFVDYMDELNISRVCTPSLKMMRYRTREMLSDIPHEHIAELVAAHPDRIVGLAGINPISGMEGVRALERAVREYGFKGAHVHPFGFGIPINEREWWPFYAKCAELDVPVVFQVGHSAEFMPSACGKPILLDDIAIWFPELRLVGGHTGWPWTEELIAMAWKHPNVYIAVSGHAPKYWDPKLVSFLNARRRGIGKVMWGTDYPLIMHAEGLSQIDEMDLKPEARVALLHDTAVKVFKFDEPLLNDESALAAGTEPLLDWTETVTPSERAALMACRLGREISDGDVVGVGLGTPLALAGTLMARKCHAPRSHLLVAGALSPDADLLTCLHGAAALAGRTAAFVPHVLTMEMAERQSMTLQFLRPAQVDGAGNANTSRIPGADGSVRRLPGGLATADVWRILPRVVVYHTDHRERSLPNRVGFITGAGGGDPQRGTRGPTCLITNRAVFRFTPAGARLESLHPGEDLDAVRRDTGFPFAAEDSVDTTAEPSSEELAALEQLDPHAIRELELRATRQAAAERLAKAQAR